MTELAIVIVLQMLFGAFQFAAVKAYSSRVAFPLIMLILAVNVCLTVLIVFGGEIWDAFQLFQTDPEFFHELYDLSEYFWWTMVSFFISGVTTLFAVIVSTKTYRGPDDD
jgi:hypothetical protein